MTKENVTAAIFLKREVEELESFVRWLNGAQCRKQETQISLDFHIKTKHWWSGGDHRTREYTLSECKQNALYRFLKCELEKDQKRLEEFSQDELDMADMYINRTLDSALAELIGEVEE